MSKAAKKRDITSVLAVRDTALTGYLIHEMAKNGGHISQDVQDQMYAIAEKFADTSCAAHFAEEASKARRPKKKNAPVAAMTPKRS